MSTVTDIRRPKNGKKLTAAAMPKAKHADAAPQRGRGGRRPVLTQDQAAEVRRLYGTPAGRRGRRPVGARTIEDLAVEFNVGRDTISAVIHKRGPYALA